MSAKSISARNRAAKLKAVASAAEGFQAAYRAVRMAPDKDRAMDSLRTATVGMLDAAAKCLRVLHRCTETYGASAVTEELIMWTRRWAAMPEAKRHDGVTWDNFATTFEMCIEAEVGGGAPDPWIGTLHHWADEESLIGGAQADTAARHAAAGPTPKGKAMPGRKAPKGLKRQGPAPTGIETLNEATRQYLLPVLEHAEWVGRELELCLSPHYHPDAVLADGYCKALRWRLGPAVRAAGKFDVNALGGYGVKPISLMSMLSRGVLGEDFPRATDWLWRLLDALPAGLWTSGKPPAESIVRDWRKATEMLRGCLERTPAGATPRADRAAQARKIIKICDRLLTLGRQPRPPYGEPAVVAEGDGITMRQGGGVTGRESEDLTRQFDRLAEEAHLLVKDLYPERETHSFYSPEDEPRLVLLGGNGDEIPVYNGRPLSEIKVREPLRGWGKRKRPAAYYTYRSAIEDLQKHGWRWVATRPQWPGCARGESDHRVFWSTPYWVQAFDQCIHRLKRWAEAELQRAGKDGGEADAPKGEGAAGGDTRDYRPATEVQAILGCSYKAFARWLADHPEIRSYKPSKYRLLVHVGDALAWKAQKDKRESEATDDQSAEEVSDRYAKTIEERKAKENARRARRTL